MEQCLDCGSMERLVRLSNHIQRSHDTSRRLSWTIIRRNGHHWLLWCQCHSRRLLYQHCRICYRRSELWKVRRISHLMQTLANHRTAPLVCRQQVSGIIQLQLVILPSLPRLPLSDQHPTDLSLVSALLLLSTQSLAIHRWCSLWAGRMTGVLPPCCSPMLGSTG